VLPIRAKRGNELVVSLAFPQHNQKRLVLPQVTSSIAVLPPEPQLHALVVGVFQDRADPRDTFATAEIWRAFPFVRSLRDTMPEASFLPLAKRLSAATDRPAAQARLRLNEIAVKECEHGIDIPSPRTVVVLEANQCRKPSGGRSHAKSSRGFQHRRLNFSSRSSVLLCRDFPDRCRIRSISSSFAVFKGCVARGRSPTMRRWQ